MTKNKVNFKDELDALIPDVSMSGIMILQRLEAFAQLSPSAIAVEYQKQVLTYFQLNQKANQLANYLIQLDVKEGVRICTLFEPSLEAIVALLAIFKVGATYVPIDPEFPLARIDLLIK